jgi:hypothetical protein
VWEIPIQIRPQIVLAAKLKILLDAKLKILLDAKLIARCVRRSACSLCVAQRALCASLGAPLQKYCILPLPNPTLDPHGSKRLLRHCHLIRPFQIGSIDGCPVWPVCSG